MLQTGAVLGSGRPSAIYDTLPHPPTVYNLGRASRFGEEVGQKFSMLRLKVCFLRAHHYLSTSRPMCFCCVTFVICCFSCCFDVFSL